MFNDLMQIVIGILILDFILGILTGMAIVLLIYRFVKDDE